MVTNISEKKYIFREKIFGKNHISAFIAAFLSDQQRRRGRPQIYQKKKIISGKICIGSNYEQFLSGGGGA